MLIFYYAGYVGDRTKQAAGFNLLAHTHDRLRQVPIL
jgi:hypothetical protein